MAANEPQVVSQFPLPPRQYIAPFVQHNAEPPPPPDPPLPDTSYAMFGRVYATTDRLPTLSEANRVCLYDEALPPTAELRRLNARLLGLFYALLATLATPSAPHAPVVARIEDVLINMHHLLNTLRPAQAAADLRGILAEQEAKRRKAAAALAEASKLAEEEISDVARLLRTEPGKESAEEAAVRDAIRVVQEHAKAHGAARACTGDGPANGRGKLGRWYKGAGDVGGAGSGGELVSSTKRDEKVKAGFSADVLAEIERIASDPNL
jgi:MED7 protein